MEALYYLNEVLTVTHPGQKGDRAKYHCLRSGVHLALGDSMAARGDASEAVELAPHMTEGYIRRAEACEAMGDWDRARADYERAQVSVCVCVCVIINMFYRN